MEPRKHFGYEHWFELYLMHDRYGAEEWRKILFAVSQYIGFLRSWTLFVHIEDNTLRYFVGTNKDIATLSNNLDGVTLRPIEPSLVAPPYKYRKRALSAAGNRR